MIIIGTKTFVLPEGAQVTVMTNGTPFQVVHHAEPKDYLIPQVDSRSIFRATQEMEIQVIQDEFDLASVEILDPYEFVDPVPFEIPEDMKRPQTMDEKMKMFLGQMLAERYGADSDEVESFEEAMDFDLPDDDPLSGYEVIEMTEDYVEPEPGQDDQGSQGDSKPPGTDDPGTDAKPTSGAPESSVSDDQE